MPHMDALSLAEAVIAYDDHDSDVASQGPSHAGAKHRIPSTTSPVTTDAMVMIKMMIII